MGDFTGSKNLYIFFSLGHPRQKFWKAKNMGCLKISWVKGNHRVALYIFIKTTGEGGEGVGGAKGLKYSSSGRDLHNTLLMKHTK